MLCTRFPPKSDYVYACKCCFSSRRLKAYSSSFPIFRRPHFYLKDLHTHQLFIYKNCYMNFLHTKIKETSINSIIPKLNKNCNVKSVKEWKWYDLSFENKVKNKRNYAIILYKKKRRFVLLWAAVNYYKKNILHFLYNPICFSNKTSQWNIWIVRLLCVRVFEYGLLIRPKTFLKYLFITGNLVLRYFKDLYSYYFKTPTRVSK